MKRNLILFGLSVMLVGCGSDSGQDSSVASDAENTAAASQLGGSERHSTETSQPVSAVNTATRPVKLGIREGGDRKGSALCNIEYIDGERFSQDIVRGRTDVSVAGWVGDEISKVGPIQPSLRLVSVDQRSRQWKIPLSLGVERPDVAAHFQESGLSEVGFLQEISLENLPGGRYHLFLAYTSNGVFFTCDNGRHLVID